MDLRAARTIAATLALLALMTACAPQSGGPVVSPVTVKIATSRTRWARPR